MYRARYLQLLSKEDAVLSIDELAEGWHFCSTWKQLIHKDSDECHQCTCGWRDVYYKAFKQVRKFDLVMSTTHPNDRIARREGFTLFHWTTTNDQRQPTDVILRKMWYTAAIKWRDKITICGLCVEENKVTEAYNWNAWFGWDWKGGAKC